MLGAVLDRNMTVKMFREADIPILHVPWQELSLLTQQLAARARTAATKDRQTFGRLKEIDAKVWKQARKLAIPQEHRHTYDALATGSTWNATQKYNAGLTGEARCIHCGQEHPTVVDMIKYCPHFQDIRDQYLGQFTNLNIKDIPNAIILGIPLAMCIDNTKTFWGQTPEDIGINHLSQGTALAHLGIRDYPKEDHKLSPSTEGYISIMTNNNFSIGHRDNALAFSNARQLFNTYEV